MNGEEHVQKNWKQKTGVGKKMKKGASMSHWGSEIREKPQKIVNIIGNILMTEYHDTLATRNWNPTKYI